MVPVPIRVTYGSVNQTVRSLPVSLPGAVCRAGQELLCCYSLAVIPGPGTDARRTEATAGGGSVLRRPCRTAPAPTPPPAAAAAAVGRPAPWSRPSGLKHTQGQTADGQVRLRLSADQTRLLRPDQAVEVRPNCRWPGQTVTRSREAQEIANVPAVPVFDSFL